MIDSVYSSTSPRELLLRIQRRAYRRNLRLIKKSTVTNSRIHLYARGYHRHLTQFQGISSRREMLHHLLLAEIVYHGDFHSLPQSQLSVYQSLKELVTRRDVVLCLEAFHARDQGLLDQFLAGEISQSQFLESVNFEAVWGFKWDHWRPIIELCRRHGIPVLGINTTQFDHCDDSVKQRDRFFSKVIGRALLGNPGKLVYVVIGEFHMSPNHLPAEVNRRLAVFDVVPKSVFVYQNSDHLYWKLAREGTDDADVLRINETSFCIMSSSPLEKTQSFLDWIEFTDDLTCVEYDHWDDFVRESAVETIPSFIQTLSAVIGLKLPDHACDRLTVIGGRGFDLMEIVDEIAELREHRLQFAEKIQRGEGFLVPYGSLEKRSYLLYFPPSSLVVAAEQAAHFVHVLARGHSDAPSAPFDRFYSLVMSEALGFFGSKLICPRRKALSPSALRSIQKRGSEGAKVIEELSLPRFLLQHTRLERSCADPALYRKRFSILFGSRNRQSGSCGRQLGYLLGDRLYTAMKRNHFTTRELREIFTHSLIEPLSAFEAYIALSRRLRNLPPPSWISGDQKNRSCG